MVAPGPFKLNSQRSGGTGAGTFVIVADIESEDSYNSGMVKLLATRSPKMPTGFENLVVSGEGAHVSEPVYIWADSMESYDSGVEAPVTSEDLPQETPVAPEEVEEEVEEPADEESAVAES
jgi:hypothetical protein